MIRELKEENKKLKEMLVKVSKAGSLGQPINLKDLGIENMEELIDDMTENEKILDDIQKPWAEKLAEAKTKDFVKVDDTN